MVIYCSPRVLYDCDVPVNHVLRLDPFAYSTGAAPKVPVDGVKGARIICSATLPSG
jgi:hypothetical protein